MVANRPQSEVPDAARVQADLDNAQLLTSRRREILEEGDDALVPKSIIPEDQMLDGRSGLKTTDDFRGA